MASSRSPDVSIDRLVLDMPGRSAEEARRIALLVADGLAAAGALPQAGDLPTMRVAVTGDPHSDSATIARRIVVATLREIARSV
jgi:hypothetical protein